MRKKAISIVGAGLGGVTAALALRRVGFDVTLFEQAAKLGEVGAGIQLSPNAMRVFAALDLEAAVLAAAFEPDNHVVRSWNTGGVVSSTPMKSVFKNKFGAGYYGFHRADLHAVLVDALPHDCIRLNAECVGVETAGAGATLRFADGSEVESDLVIGADGIRSVVADSLFGRQSPRFTGNICWRGLTSAASLPPGLVSPDMSAYFGPDAHVITYYVRGGAYVNWFACRRQDDWRQESWRQEVSSEEVLTAYGGWCPTLLELFAKTERCYKWALFDRDPRSHWTRESATLLGDAAHPMLPTLAQGACMAVEDAYALSAFIARFENDLPLALKGYEAARLPRVSRVQLLARSRAAINQLASPRARLLRNIGYGLRKLIHPSRHTYGIEWIYGYDVTSVTGA